MKLPPPIIAKKDLRDPPYNTDPTKKFFHCSHTDSLHGDYGTDCTKSYQKG